MQLTIQDLTQQAFRPFGRVIQQPDRVQDAQGPGWRWWSENALMESADRPYQIGYLHLEPAELKFDWAERHMRSAELIIPTGGDCLVYVAPPDYPDEPERMPAFERFQVFRVRAGQAVLLEKGVWHGAPLAIDKPLQAIVLLLSRTGEVDLSLVRFEENPVRIK